MFRLVVVFCLTALVLGASVSKTGFKIHNGTKIGFQGGPVDMTSGKGGTYPRANFLNDGSLIGAYTGFVDGNHVMTLVRSTDGGSSWTFLGTAATRPSDSSDMDNPYPLQLPNGRVLLAFREHDKDPGSGAYTFYRITICYSDDNGVNWQYLSTPTTMPGGNIGMWEPLLRNAQDGSLQLYYSKENAPDDQDTIERISYDGGASWGPEMTISGYDITARDGMTGVATIDGQNLIAVFEVGQGTFRIDSITSNDDGKTWGNRRTVYRATGDNNNAGAPQVVNVGGTLCVSFMTDEDTQQHHWINGAAAKIITSTDGGNSWGNKLEVFAPQANWPGMLALDGNTLLYMADNNGAKSQRLTL